MNHRKPPDLHLLLIHRVSDSPVFADGNYGMWRVDLKAEGEAMGEAKILNRMKRGWHVTC